MGGSEGGEENGWGSKGTYASPSLIAKIFFITIPVVFSVSTR